jgi:flagellar hook assembly protein FlgD
LLPNYPNPFNAATRIAYQLPERSHVKLVLRDLMGRELRILANEEREAGTHEVGWDGRDASDSPLPSGVYIYSLQAGSFRSSKKLLIVK